MDRHDGDAMAKLYAPDGRFRDPAFGELTGAEAGDMWRMLTGRSEDLGGARRARGRRRHRDGPLDRHLHLRTGRPVTNDIRAEFRFRDGKITEHRDSFSFWRWSRQALGPVGLALGWTPLLRAAVRKRARADLADFRRAG